MAAAVDDTRKMVAGGLQQLESMLLTAGFGAASCSMSSAGDGGSHWLHGGDDRAGTMVREQLEHADAQMVSEEPDGEYVDLRV